MVCEIEEIEKESLSIIMNNMNCNAKVKVILRQFRLFNISICAVNQWKILSEFIHSSNDQMITTMSHDKSYNKGGIGMAQIWNIEDLKVFCCGTDLTGLITFIDFQKNLQSLLLHTTQGKNVEQKQCEELSKVIEKKPLY